MGKPEIRFKGYTDEWEQRKLGDVLERRIEQRQQSEEYPRLAFASGQGVIPLSERKTNNREQLTKDEYTKKYLVTELNDIVYNPANVKYGAIDRNKCRRGLISPIYVTFTTNEIPGFIERIVTSHDFQQRALRFEEGTVTKRQSVNPEDLVTLDILVAPKREEQQKIATYFDSLDHLITLQQRKCDEVKSLKKYMLQKMFPQNEQKVPEIRFEGFTEAWEQRKLGDVAEFSKGSGYSKGDLIESGTPIILYGRLYTKYETIISDVDTFVEAKDGSVYSKGGEVIVPASGETAEDIARAASVDKSGILLGGDLNVVMPNEDINSAFLAISISNGSSQRELARKAQGKSVVHIHNEEIRNLIVPFPTKTEQNKIENYFADLDHLITLHQQKCEELKKIKKFMLQKMFV